MFKFWRNPNPYLIKVKFKFNFLFDQQTSIPKGSMDWTPKFTLMAKKKKSTRSTKLTWQMNSNFETTLCRKTISPVYPKVRIYLHTSLQRCAKNELEKSKTTQSKETTGTIRQRHDLFLLFESASNLSWLVQEKREEKKRLHE